MNLLCLSANVHLNEGQGLLIGKKQDEIMMSKYVCLEEYN